MTGDAVAPGPGWYADPNDATTQRYWDGSAWTESRAPLPSATKDKDDFTATDGVGYALAALMPLVGFIFGLVRLNKSKHGVWIVVVSVVAFLIWIAIVSASATGGGGGGAYY